MIKKELRKFIKITRKLRTLWKWHRDVNLEHLDNIFNINGSTSLVAYDHNSNNYVKQIRFNRYMVFRIDHLLKKRQYLKCIHIFCHLISRSQSFHNLSFMYRSQVGRLNQILDEEVYWLGRENVINRLLGKMELIIGCYLVLLVCGAYPQLEITPTEEISTGASGLPLFITLTIGIITILLTFRKDGIPDIPISGPMTEVEYAWLQDTLSYQAWLDNLAISPIGELWRLPF